MSRHKTKQRMMAMVLSVIMVVGMMPVSALAETSTFPIGTSGEIIAFETLGLDIAFQYVPYGTGKGDLELPDTLTATLRIAALDEELVLDSGETDTKPDSADIVSGSAIGMDEKDDTEAEAETKIASPSDAQEDGDSFEAEPMEKTVDSVKEITVPLPVTWASSPEYNNDTPGIYVFTPVFSDGITIGDDVEAPTINVMLHSSEFVAIDEDAGKGLPKSAGTWVLQQLAAGAVSYVGGVAMEEAMAQIFGKSPSEIDGLIREFQDIKNSIEKTERKINELISKVDQANLKNDLRTHWELMSRYAGVYGALCGSIDDRKGNVALTNLFLTELYSGADGNYNVAGMSIINATLTLGNTLTRTFPGANYNTFGAFDKLDKYTYRWEHQGYAQRQAFRNEAILTYGLFSAMSQLACETVIANNQGDTTAAINERMNATRWLKELQENALKVAEMDGRCAVIEHPDLRIYRDTKRGEDLYTFRTEIQKGYMYQPTDPEWSTFTRNANMLASKEFLRPMSKAVRYNLEYYSWGYMVYSQQPSNAIYKRIYDDYKAANGGVYGISLMQIFFNDDKGDFTHPTGEVLLDNGPYFVNNAYTWKGKREYYGEYLYNAGQWTMTVTNEFGTSRTKELMDGVFKDGTSPLLRVGKPSTEIFYSPILYYGKVEQGMLMLPEDEHTPEPAEGMVTFDLNGGSRTGGGELIQIVAEGNAATAPTVHRSNYTFIGWDKSFDNVTSDMTVTASWRYNGGGGSSSNNNRSPVIVTPPAPDKPNSPTQGEIKVPGTVDSKGNVTVNISDKAVADAFAQALAEAKKNGTEQNGITVMLRVDTGSKTAASVTVNLPKSVQDTIIGNKIVSVIVVVDNPDIRIGMDLSTMQEINNQAKSNVNITVTRADSGKLATEAKKAIGSRPVFDLKVNYGNGKAVSSFGAGNVSVTIPYTLGANEKAGNVQAVYVDGNGKVHWLVNSVYDGVEQVLRFSTNHFSTYGIGYKQASTAFTDITAHWAKEDIEFVASRGLFSGTSATTFSPNTAMTRGMFVTALGRLANADVSGYAKSSFTDVKSDAYYMGYIEWASKNSVVNGTGNRRFAPDQSITREQMAVIMQNYAKSTGFTLPKVHEENTFADNGKISTYAKEAVKQMQMAGVISGKNGNLYDPQGTATRAEVSAVLRRFVALAISSDTMQGWTMNDSGQWMYYENGKPVIGKKDIDGTTYTFDQYGVTADVPKNLRYTTYTVQKGDNFWSISRKLNCTMTELERLNNKSRFSIIHSGDVLQVPEQK